MAKLLLVSSVLPWPLHRNGGGQRTALLRRALQRLGHEVNVLGVVPDLGGATPAASELAAHGVVAVLPVAIDLPPRRLHLPGPLGSLARLRRLWTFRYAAREPAVRWLDARLDGYDGLFVRYLQTALLCGLDARPAEVRDRCRIDLDDVDWLTLQSRFAAEPWPGLVGPLAMRQTLRLVRRRCATAMGKFPERYVASGEDAAALAREGIDAAVLPNVPFDQDAAGPLPPSADDGRDVLFVGDLEFPPNRDGLERFLSQCWPVVREKVAGARLRVVGRGLDAARRQRWSQVAGVEPVGFADDLSAEYAAAAVTVAPIWWGGGTKIKVVESAANGRACVASAAATRGFGALIGHGVVRADDDAAMAAAVASLLLDPAARHAAERAGPAAAARHYSFDSLVATLAAGEAVSNAMQARP